MRGTTLPKEKTNKRAQQRELRKEKLQKRTEERKLPWEERKKRLRERKKKETKQKRMKMIAFVSVIVIICCVASAVAMFLPESQETEEFFRGRPPGGGNLNLEEWGTSGNVSVPEGEMDLRGRIIEDNGNKSFTIQTMQRGAEPTEERIKLEEDINIFTLDRESQTLFAASIDEIGVYSMLMIWGEKGSDGTWIVSDCGLMMFRR